MLNVLSNMKTTKVFISYIAYEYSKLSNCRDEYAFWGLVKQLHTVRVWFANLSLLDCVISKGKNTPVAFFDLSKAFDIIDSIILI